LPLALNVDVSKCCGGNRRLIESSEVGTALHNARPRRPGQVVAPLAIPPRRGRRTRRKNLLRRPLGSLPPLRRRPSVQILRVRFVVNEVQHSHGGDSPSLGRALKPPQVFCALLCTSMQKLVGKMFAQAVHRKLEDRRDPSLANSAGHEQHRITPLCRRRPERCRSPLPRRSFPSSRFFFHGLSLSCSLHRQGCPRHDTLSGPGVQPVPNKKSPDDKAGGHGGGRGQTFHHPPSTSAPEPFPQYR
jgi:hypothetical protein